MIAHSKQRINILNNVIKFEKIEKILLYNCGEEELNELNGPSGAHRGGRGLYRHR